MSGSAVLAASTTPTLPHPPVSTIDTPAADSHFSPSSMGETLQFAHSSARVKCVDVHPTKPWLLSALYDGRVVLHNTTSKSVERTIQVCASPVRVARFVPRMNWIITGSDDRNVRVFHAESGEKLAEFVAHDDFVRDLHVHATKSLVFTCGDDRTIKVWDWSQDWQRVHELHGHDHYVMALALSASGRDLATVSLDHSVRLWSLPDQEAGVSSQSMEVSAHTTLREAHSNGVNAVAFDATGASLFTGSDDHTVRVWDLAAQQVTAVLHGHTHNVTSVAVHPSLPLLLSGSEDGSVRLWSTDTRRCIGVWTHGQGRAWSIAVLPATNAIAIGYDRGTVVVELPASLVTA